MRSGRSHFRVALVEQITVLISTSIAGEGNELFPRFVAEFHDRWVSCAPFLGHVIGCGPGRIRIGAPLDGSEIGSRSSQYLRDESRKEPLMR